MYLHKKNQSSINEEITIGIKGRETSLSYELSTNTIFDLSSNNLIGEIPATIGRMSSLRLLNLSRNQLKGIIPASIGQISTLEQLDLSINNLSDSLICIGWVF